MDARALSDPLHHSKRPRDAADAAALPAADAAALPHNKRPRHAAGGAVAATKTHPVKCNTVFPGYYIMTHAPPKGHLKLPPGVLLTEVEVTPPARDTLRSLGYSSLASYVLANYGEQGVKERKTRQNSESKRLRTAWSKYDPLYERQLIEYGVERARRNHALVEHLSKHGVPKAKAAEKAAAASAAAAPTTADAAARFDSYRAEDEMGLKGKQPQQAACSFLYSLSPDMQRAVLCALTPDTRLFVMRAAQVMAETAGKAASAARVQAIAARSAAMVFERLAAAAAPP